MVSGLLLKKSSMVSGCTYFEGLLGTKDTKGDWRGGYSILNTLRACLALKIPKGIGGAAIQF